MFFLKPLASTVSLYTPAGTLATKWPASSVLVRLLSFEFSIMIVAFATPFFFQSKTTPRILAARPLRDCARVMIGELERHAVATSRATTQTRIEGGGVII
jgi:hypothetical protein